MQLGLHCPDCVLRNTRMRVGIDIAPVSPRAHNIFFSNISDGRNFSSSGTAIPFYFSTNVWLNREMREGGIWFKG